MTVFRSWVQRHELVGSIQVTIDGEGQDLVRPSAVGVPSVGDREHDDPFAGRCVDDAVGPTEAGGSPALQGAEELLADVGIAVEALDDLLRLRR